MKHRVAGRKLGRTSEHRLALLRNLSSALFSAGRIRTTLGKAKELRPFAERLVTLAKRVTLHARRQVLRHIHDREVVGKLFDSLSARYAQRPGGYTRIIKLGPRRGDNAEMALIELVGAEVTAASEAPDKAAKGEAAAPKTEAKAQGKAKAKGAAKARRAAKAQPKAPKRGAAKGAGRPAKPAAPPKKKKAGVRKAGKGGGSS